MIGVIPWNVPTAHAHKHACVPELMGVGVEKTVDNNYFVRLGISECLRAPSISAKTSKNESAAEHFTTPVVYILYYKIATSQYHTC